MALTIITREQWGARPFTCSEPAPPIDGLVVHYTGMDADEQADHANCDNRVRGIQNYHMDTKHWCDIAYNFVVCKHGSVYEGRGWSRKSGATGADNSHTIAICFLGDDTAGKDDVTADGREALGTWVRAGLTRYAGASVKGHRDYMVTTCPGDELMGWIARKGWEQAPPRRVRFELWARRKNDEGKWRPYMVTHSKPTRLGEGRPKARATAFLARVSPRMAALAARNRRPHVRRVEV